MKNKAFKLGIIVGRFQTFHTGHLDMVDKACAVCDRVGIFVGSSQESGTLKNPFTYEARRSMLQKVCGDRVTIRPLPDIGVGNTAKWGEYVLQQVRMCYGKTPDLLISGKEERRINWFDGASGISVAELYIPKTIDMSATRMRQFFIDDNKAAWQRYTPSVLWDDYEAMKKTVLAAKDNLQTASI